MTDAARTPAGDALTELLLDLFSLNNRVLSAGDRLVAGLGLTSARWQILGAIVAADRQQPVAWLARDLGAHRQNVQRIVNDLKKEGLVTLRPNPHHSRAQLVALTDKGKEAYGAAMRLQVPWISGLSDGLSLEDIEKARNVMSTLRDRLDGGGEP